MVTASTDRGAADAEQDRASQQDRDLLRFVICGNANGGKSTLVRQLLSECDAVRDDALASMASDLQGGVGMLMGNPHVTYRSYASGKRLFIIAETSGLDHDLRNIVAAASTADVAVLLIDASDADLMATRHLSHLVSLLGVRRIVLAVNKLDLVDYSKDVFKAIESDYRVVATPLRLSDVTCIPISAAHGHNVGSVSARTAWYRGPSLMRYLETVEVRHDERARPLRIIVQRVNSSTADFRGVSGRIASGSVRLGDRVRVLPRGAESVVARIVMMDGEVDVAVAGRSATIALRDEVDMRRGDIIAAAASPPAIADQFEATVMWMYEDDMLPGRPYLASIGERTTGLVFAAPKYKVNERTLEHLAARTLKRNEIGVCNLSLDEPVPFDPYDESRETGEFVVMDPTTNHPIGVALVHFALRRSQNVHWQVVAVDKEAHAALKGHRPCVVWFTGLSGAGKSTIANIVEKKLHAMGRHTYLLDGDNVRHGLNRDLGFTEADRVENIRRVAEVARLMVDAGLIVLVSFISPFRAERRMARRLVRPGEFCEVFVDTPLAVAEQRDRKGLYAKARRGELVNFTGIDSPYEPPERPELRVDTVSMEAEQAADAVIERLRALRLLDPPSARH